MPDIDELLDFITARLGEAEAIARAASPGPWTANAEEDEVLAVDGERVTDGFALSGPQLRATVAHIARHDPYAVKLDVEATRRILAIREATRMAVEVAKDTILAGGTRVRLGAYDKVLLALASRWSTHPAYRPEWKVED